MNPKPSWISFWEELFHGIIFKSRNEFRDFSNDSFVEYHAYDKANPDRFKVEYDENLNRILK